MKPLAEFRKERGLSQQQLAKELSSSGITISSASIAMYETGKRNPSLEKARFIARFFGVTTDDISYGKPSHRLEGS